MSRLPVLYDCSRCPAYCCTYTRIEVTPRDLVRLGKRFDITPEEAERKFTRKGYEPGERILRHRKDEIFGTACRFLDPETRRCTIYEHRPSICRAYPATRRCGYWEFLKFERNAQEDKELAVTAWVYDP